MNRLYYGLSISNPMLNEIKNMCLYMFNLIITATSEAEELCPFPIPKEEIAYLTLHFKASVERFEKMKAE